ncbi:chromate efflux transporter [Pseudaminobacter soli (ex Li et al. 2025)]|uniref:Chromate transporter n=1 Tax=Pseudaminobacter soli (ex Li et al. 2025) TaxID=1295366 RepID=A0A2P7RPT1_9HYPH|nr:chromate efflux transporter [Mesorhizobium soli]PSJ52227.1 chromate transporter [Mesorhizobium soli]
MSKIGDRHAVPDRHAGVPAHGISFGEAVRVWARVAALSFGGPAGQIAVMHRILVEEKRWIGETRFLHALNYCMLLPGPEAQQLAIYVGWLLHKTKGGLIAGALFVLPGFVSILALSYIYATVGNVGIVEGLFFGLKAAVLTIVVQAVLRIGQRALRNTVMVGIAVAALVAIFFFRVPFPLIILAAGLAGYIGGRMGSPFFRVGGGHKADGNALADKDAALGEDTPRHARPNIAWSLKISGILLLLWLLPVTICLALLGRDSVFSQIAVFFSQMAMVTFGGAYAVLAYVAQEAVQHYGWLQPGEMLDGLGMAETTPGPLIMVVQFVGFMGAFRDPGVLNPMVAGTLGALLTTWVTFVPCFLWIFLGAPYIEALRSNAALTGAMSAITAAVVGVVMNLAAWFALHTLFGQLTPWRGLGVLVDVPVWQTANVPAMVLTVAAAIATFGYGVRMIPTLLACSIAGMVWYLAGGNV